MDKRNEELKRKKGFKDVSGGQIIRNYEVNHDDGTVLSYFLIIGGEPPKTCPKCGASLKILLKTSDKSVYQCSKDIFNHRTEYWRN